MAMFWHFVSERDYLHEDAYRACEKTLEDHRLPGKYDSYESFKTVKSRMDSRRSRDGDIIVF